MCVRLIYLLPIIRNTTRMAHLKITTHAFLVETSGPTRCLIETIYPTVIIRQFYSIYSINYRAEFVPR